MKPCLLLEVWNCKTQELCSTSLCSTHCCHAYRISSKCLYSVIHGQIHNLVV